MMEQYQKRAGVCTCGWPSSEPPSCRRWLRAIAVATPMSARMTWPLWSIRMLPACSCKLHGDTTDHGQIAVASKVRMLIHALDEVCAAGGSLQEDHVFLPAP